MGVVWPFDLRRSCDIITKYHELEVSYCFYEMVKKYVNMKVPIIDTHQNK